MAERLAVALDLVLAALGERQAHAARSGTGTEHVDGEGYGRAVVEPHTLTPSRQIRARDASGDVRLVDAWDLIARMQQAVSERAVVGQQEHAFDVGVETADRKQPCSARNEIGDDGAPVGIVARADVAGGLVQQQVLPGLGATDRAAVEPDVVDVGIGQRPRLADDDAVDGDAALEDEPISSPA